MSAADRNPAGISSVGQIAINVRDVARAVSFYRDTLGLRHLFDAGPRMSFFDCGGTRLMLSLPESPEYDHAGSVLYYKVSDITAAHAAISERGGQFVDSPHLVARLPDHELWMAFLRDTEGNTLALMSEVRP